MNFFISVFMKFAPVQRGQPLRVVAARHLRDQHWPAQSVYIEKKANLFSFLIFVNCIREPSVRGVVQVLQRAGLQAGRGRGERGDHSGHEVLADKGERNVFVLVLVLTQVHVRRNV